MNKVILTGYLTGDASISYNGDDNKAMARFSIAVNRSYKNKDGNYDADFIKCFAFGKNAENIEKYFHKGSPITVEGEWRTGRYKDKEGNMVYTNECQISKWEFPIKSKSDSDSPKTNDTASAQESKDEDFVNVDSADTGDIPFFD